VIPAVAILLLLVGTPHGRTPEPCPAGMRWIEGGRFVRNDRVVVTVAPFCLDATEVTAAAYADCVDNGTCSAEGLDCSPRATYGVRERARHPVNCVTWFDADAFCRDLGKRLPSEEEWEWAARGRDRGTAFPWGDLPPGDRACWDGEGNALGRGERAGTCPVASFPAGDSPGGVSDLAGGVREWTASAEGKSRIVRGGSWGDTEPAFLSSSFRGMNGPEDRLELTGFRCATPPGAKVVDPAARAAVRARDRERERVEAARRAKSQGAVDLSGVRIIRDQEE